MYDHDDLFVKSGECFCWYCFIITCIIDLRLREGLMMLTVIYFVLVQPLDNDDRGILDIYQEHSSRYNLTFYTDNPPYLDQNQDHSHFIIKHLLYQQRGLSSWISHLSASAQRKHQHLKKKIPPLFCSRWLRNSGQKCWELKTVKRTGTWGDVLSYGGCWWHGPVLSHFAHWVETFYIW